MRPNTDALHVLLNLKRVISRNVHYLIGMEQLALLALAEIRQFARMTLHAPSALVKIRTHTMAVASVLNVIKVVLDVKVQQVALVVNYRTRLRIYLLLG